MIKKKEDTEEEPREDGGRDGRDAATSPATPGAPRSWKRREGPSPGASAGERGPAHTWISDFWSPGLGEDKCLLFKATWFLVIFCGNPRKLVQPCSIYGMSFTPYLTSFRGTYFLTFSSNYFIKDLVIK